MPEVEGPRPVPVRVTNKYVDRVLAAAESDIVVAEQLAKVITLIDPPTRLLRPAVNAIRQPRQRSGSVTHRQLGTASRERPRKLTQANSIAAPGNQRTQVMSPSPPGDRVVLKIATTKTF